MKCPHCNARLSRYARSIWLPPTGLPSFCDRCFSTVKIRIKWKSVLLFSVVVGSIGAMLALWIPLNFIPFGMSLDKFFISFVVIASLIFPDVGTELIPEANKIPEAKKMPEAKTIPNKNEQLTVCMRCMGQIHPSWQSCPNCGLALSEVSPGVSGVAYGVGILILVPLLLGVLFGVPAWFGYERITEFVAESKAQKIRDAEARKPPPISHYATATSISYRDALLRRIPLGTLIVVDGKVSQTWDKKVSIRLSINHDLVHVEFDKMPEVVEEDLVSIFGRYNGVVTYKTISGSDNTVPYVWGDYLKIVEPRS